MIYDVVHKFVWLLFRNNDLLSRTYDKLSRLYHISSQESDFLWRFYNQVYVFCTIHLTITTYGVFISTLARHLVTATYYLVGTAYYSL